MDTACEPNLLDYARSHGLASDHRQHDHFENIYLELPGTDDEDHAKLFEIEAQAVDPLQERLVTDKNVAQILATITRPPETSLRFDEDVEPNTNKWQKLKLELPILKTDHEGDLRQFLRPHNPSLGLEHLPLEGLDEELDEGLGWPSYCLKLGEQIEHQCWTDKLVISKDAIGVLADVVRNEPSDADLKFDTENVPTYKRNIALTPITPPLLPLPRPALPYQPSSETGRLELVPEGPSPTKKILDDIDERLLVRDRPAADTCTLGQDNSAAGVTTPEIQAQEHPIVQDTEKSQDGTSSNPSKGEFQSQDEMLLDSEALGELYSPLKFINETPSSPTIRLKKEKPPKLEVPMTPPRSDLRAPKTEEDDVLAQAMKSISQTTFEKNLKMDLPSSQELDAFFAETIEPVAKKADQAIEQEQLQSTDTLGRVPVPLMDFFLPAPPWNAVQSRHGKGPILHDLKTQHLHKSHWPAVGRVERQLQWAPFPAALARVETQETIEGGDCLEEYLKAPECVDTGSLVWKPDGLRMFDDLNDPEEEEIPSGKFLASDDIQSLIKKRKLIMKHDGPGSSSGEADFPEEAQARATANQAEKRQRIAGEEAGTVYHEDYQTMSSGQGVTSGILGAHSLEDYLLLRKGDVSISAIHNKPVAEDGAKPRTAEEVTARLPINSLSTEHQLSKPTTADHSAVELRSIASAPILKIPTEESSFIISTSYMQDRKLIRQIEQLYPTAKYIERDFSLHTALRKTRKKGEGAEVQPADTISFEADLILSPGTGLVTTTLQKIKQRALPGQKTQSAIRERIVKISPRYEKLLVLVTSSALTSTAEGSSKFVALDPEETEALTAFMAFCTAVQEENQVYFICDDMDNLAKWIVSLMILHKAEDYGVQLLPEETLWEVFLRRAGLNAFAAQAICTSLKEVAQDKADEQRPPMEHGLKAFLSMSRDLRIARFGRLFGGSNLLHRVGHALDTSWR